MNLLKKIRAFFTGETKNDAESFSENGEMQNQNQEIIVYGTRWCYDTRRALVVLDQYQFTYNYIDIDSDRDAAKYVESVNRGYRSVPTIIFSDGSMLVEPSEGELKKKLGVG